MAPRVSTLRLPVTLLLLMAVVGVTAISAADTASNASDHHVCTRKARACQPGILLPNWQPIFNISWMDRAARAVVYLLALVYLFLGVSIIADRFMSSIEVITSSEREVTVYKSVTRPSLHSALSPHFVTRPFVLSDHGVARVWR